ncbi:MAG: retropepsin-like domain-containing protein, partial [Methylocystis sp.]|nr:retropepsin-like domain-containing protein [Methylocystis sp.]
LGRREISFFAPPMGAKTSPLRPLGPGRSLVGVDLRIGDVATIGLIDTGAEICAVDLAFLKKHRKLFVLAEKNAKASEAGGRKIAARLIKIKALDVGGGVVARDLYALVYDFGPLRAALGGEAPVILGYNFLSRIVLELDLRDAKAPTWSATLN